jgi:hypothetical protein
MGELGIMFKVSNEIELGLRSGVLERVGGVIRHSFSKQIVLWLKETATRDNQLEETLNQLSRLSRAGLVFSQTTLGVQVVSLAVTVGMLRDIQARLERMDKKLDELKELIIAEFKSNRMTDFKTALNAAEDVFEGDRSRLNSAVDGLHKSIDHFTKEFKDYVKKAQSAQQPTEARKHLTLAHDTLLRRILAISVYIRCRAVQSQQRAKKDLRALMDMLKDDLKGLAHAWLGAKPAVYLHRSLDRQAVERFAYAQSWLRWDDNDVRVPSYDVLLNVMDDLRRDFWDASAIEAQYEGVRLPFRQPLVPDVHDRTQELLENLDNVEALMENYDRLLGYELTLSSDRLSALESIEIDESQLTEETPLAFIVDEEALAQARKRLVG